MSRVAVFAPIGGWLTSVHEVPDPVFSEEMMGTGIAIDPTGGVLVAPFDGTVLLVAPTKHSVTLKAASGAELLIHVGLETVALEGRGFTAHVLDGDRVAAGDELISFDMDLVGLEAKSLVTPILLTNAGAYRWSPEPLDRLVSIGEPIGWIDGGAEAEVLPAATGEQVVRDVVVRFAHGLHARPAARIADCAKRFSSAITIQLGDKSANARSPVAIMALDARLGDGIRLSGVGRDTERALEALKALLEVGEDAHSVPANAPTVRTLADNEIGGVCALPGIVLGTAAHWRRPTATATEESRGVESERAAMEAAISTVRARLLGLAESVCGPAADIARAHVGLLDDENLNAAAQAEITRGRSAGKAWQLASSQIAEGFRSSGSALLKERIPDLDDIARQVVAAMNGDQPGAVSFGENSILLADELLPSELLSLPRDRVVGLATSGGGPTSHMAIIAASFGIPALVAMGPRLREVPEGAQVLLDASAGVLIVDPDERAQARARTVSVAEKSGDCMTLDGERVHLFANLGGLGDVQPALAAGAEGCGLLRSEFLFLDRPDAPSQEEQRLAYQAIADALGPRPLTIRTLDIGGDKPVSYLRFPDEQNPALGARGVRTILFAPALIDAQLRAIADVTGEGVKVMLPMVASVEELRSVRDRLNALRPGIALGVMVETPAAALLAGAFAEEADFLSIGSNDLAQYTLAMDRTNPLLAASIDALHPAVLRLFAMTAEAGRKAGKAVSLCGSLASDPAAALVLIGLGINDLSAVPAALPAVRQALARTAASDCRAIAEHALTMGSAAEVRALAAHLLNATSEGDIR